jgi:IS5 family transposase
VNLGVAGLRLMRRSVLGLMDTALPPLELQAVTGVLESYASRGARYHALRTRQAGARMFVSVHIQFRRNRSVRLITNCWRISNGTSEGRYRGRQSSWNKPRTCFTGRSDARPTGGVAPG